MFFLFFYAFSLLFMKKTEYNYFVCSLFSDDLTFMKAGNTVIRINYTTNINLCGKTVVVVVKIHVTHQRKSFHVKE